MSNPGLINLKDSKILVTGASGFIGSHLVLKLFDMGAVVFGISRQQREPQREVTWIKGDLGNFDFIEGVITQIQPNYIFHLASYVVGSRNVDHVFPAFHDNFLTTLNLLRVTQKGSVKRLIIAGSFEEGINVDNEMIPCSPYAAAKIAASNYARMFYHLYGTPVCIASLYMVYGPNQKDVSKLIPYVIRSTLSGKPPQISSGKRKVDWIYIDDVVLGLIIMLHSSKIDGQTVDIGTGKSIKIKSLVELLTKMIDPNVKPKFGIIKDRPMEQEKNANINETFKKIGWKPQTNLQQGLQKTIDFYTKIGI